MHNNFSNVYNNINLLYKNVKLIYYDIQEEKWEKIIKDIQLEIEEICDKMEYDGSIMFDECPDKVSVERIVKRLCEKDKLGKCCEECGSKWFNALVQVMFCNEMGYRRSRRMCHKDRMSSN